MQYYWLLVGFFLCFLCVSHPVASANSVKRGSGSLGTICSHIRDCERRIGAICGYADSHQSSSPVCRCPIGTVLSRGVCSILSLTRLLEQKGRPSSIELFRPHIISLFATSVNKSDQEATRISFGQSCNAAKDTCVTPGAVCTLTCQPAACGRCLCPSGLSLCFGQCVGKVKLNQSVSQNKI